MAQASTVASTPRSSRGTDRPKGTTITPGCHRSSGFDDDFDPDEVVRVAGSTLVAVDDTSRSRRSSSSRRITRAALDHLDATGEWQPSIVSLCRAVGVSERRLQLAFQDVFDATPGAFLRNRALSAVRQRLLDASPIDDQVTTIAHDHGFRHLGRFADYYRRTFGELPSESLQLRP